MKDQTKFIQKDHQNTGVQPPENRLDSSVTIREALSERDTAVFLAQLRAYHERDIFPDPEDEDRAYFLDESQYRAHLQKLHDRPQDRCRCLFFRREGRDIGFALPVIYETEDGKCFIMEFCVYPEFRGGGMGTLCARALLDWARENGASYAELNYGGDDRRLRFWQRAGFAKNGSDEWGNPLMLLPPEEELPITVEPLGDPEDWQLLKLLNGFLAEIGEEPLTEEKQEGLRRAIREEKITVFLAKRGYRAVGMCSVSRCFSTFSCADIGVFDDFFIEPVFRGRGTARKLARAAQDWCRAAGMASLTVCCAPCDEGMYQALGFTARLGVSFAHLTEDDSV